MAVTVKLTGRGRPPGVWPKMCACCCQAIPMGSIRVEGPRGGGKQVVYLVPCCEGCRRHFRVRTLGIVAAVVFCAVGLPIALTPLIVSDAPAFGAAIGLALCLGGIGLYALAKREAYKFMTDRCGSVRKAVSYYAAREGPAFVFQNASYAEEFRRLNGAA